MCVCEGGTNIGEMMENWNWCEGRRDKESLSGSCCTEVSVRIPTMKRDQR